MNELLCPESAYVVARPEHVPVVEGFYDWGRPGLMLRMAMRSEDFRGKDSDCVRLTTSDLDDLTAFYADGGVNSFSPEHMEYNVFYGVFEEGHLVAAAGTHAGQPDLRRGGSRERIHRRQLPGARLWNGHDERRRRRSRAAGHPGHRPDGRTGERRRGPGLRAAWLPPPLSHRRRTGQPQPSNIALTAARRVSVQSC